MHALGRWEQDGLKSLRLQLDDLSAKYNGTSKARQGFCRTWVKLMVDETEVRQQWRAQEDIMNDLGKFGELQSKTDLVGEVTKVLAKRASLLGEPELIVALKFLSMSSADEITKVLKIITRDVDMQQRLLLGIKSKVSCRDCDHFHSGVNIYAIRNLGMHS
jgi:hypothetical protein